MAAMIDVNYYKLVGFETNTVLFYGIKIVCDMKIYKIICILYFVIVLVHFIDL